MTLRTRLALLVAVAVAVAVASVSAVSYLTVRANLRAEVDRTLLETARAPAVLATPGGGLGRTHVAAPPPGAGLTDRFVLFNVLAPGGELVNTGGGAAIPIAAEGSEVIQGVRPQSLYDAKVAGRHMRVAVVGGPGIKTLVIARPLAEVDNTMRRLGWLLLIASGLGVLIAATVGRAIARAGLSPVDRLTEAAERVARTRDLRSEIPVEGNDEISRLARSFNAMLTALDTSQRRQRELVSDASHELRTPLTSLRTNMDLLARADSVPGRELSAEDRHALLADVRLQLDEMTHLVEDLTSVARDGEAQAPTAVVDLAGVVTTSIERARRRAPGVSFHADLAQSLVVGNPGMLERAVTNVLDNAAKWSPAGSAVDVQLRDGELVVRDRGPGIAAEDAPHVFDRFYRAPAARSMPGSGLGLAIVHDVVHGHGGTASVEPAGDTEGGTVVRLRLPAHDLMQF